MNSSVKRNRGRRRLVSGKMPLYLRQVWPVAVGRKFTPESSTFERRDANAGSSVHDNLVYSKEESANRALANIIRQLADLGKKSHQIFGGLL